MFGPLSYLEVVGQPHIEVFEGNEVVVVSVKINVNLKAQRIEEMIAKRKEIHKSSFRFLVDDVRYDLLKMVEEQGAVKLKKRAVHDSIEKADFEDCKDEDVTKKFVEAYVEPIMQHVEETRQTHNNKGVEDFISNDIYRSLVLEMLDTSNMALSKLRLYLEDQGQIRVLWQSVPLKVAHRSLIAFIKRTLPNNEIRAPSNDEIRQQIYCGPRYDAILSLCKLKGLLVKNVQEKNEYDETRLMQASADGLSVQDIKLLGEIGVPINDSDKFGSTAFLLAAQFGHAEILEVLHQLKADISHTDKTGLSALHKAAINGHVECLKTLSELKADMNQLSSESDSGRRGDQLPPAMSALMFAAMYGHTDCLSVLHQLGSNIHYKMNLDSDSPPVDATFWAVINGRADSVQAISEMGVNMEPEGPVSETEILNFAKDRGHHHVVSLLHSLRKWTPLIIAIDQKEEQGAIDLIAQGADVNAKNKINRSALHYAAMKNSIELISALVRAKADINAIDVYGKSPLDLADVHDDKDSSNVLKELGADMWNALMVAAEDGDAKWEQYFELRESVICMHDRLPFPGWFSSKLETDTKNVVTEEDTKVGLDNSLWTEEADRLLEELPTAGV